MRSVGSPSVVTRRNVKAHSNQISGVNDNSVQEEDLKLWQKHAQELKVKVLEQVQDQLSDLLDKALIENVPPFYQKQPAANGTTTHPSSRSQRMDDGKVFMARPSVLDELFEISHIRTIYHMFIAVLLIFFLSTLTVDYIDQGRLVLEFDLLFYAFGNLGTVTWAWIVMFAYTLLVPYYAMRLWGSLYHTFPSKLGLSLSTGLLLSAVQICVLGQFPVHVVVQYQLPPASRFIVILEQIRFVMKSYSFIRETAPLVMNNPPKEGENPRFPTLSSYLYFLFCPTLIYRESYPRNSHIRWNYVFVTVGMIFGCLFYGYFVLVRLCVPVFRPETNQPFTKRSMVLAVFNSILPGIMLLLLCFFAFLHCWLNLFAELLQFADRMFYKDWWNSTSFTNYYRTWNVVVHDWLFYYGYRDFLWEEFTQRCICNTDLQQLHSWTHMTTVQEEIQNSCHALRLHRVRYRPRVRPVHGLRLLLPSHVLPVCCVRSGVQLHSERQAPEPRVQRHHVGVSVRRPGRPGVSLLSGVVCPGPLPSHRDAGTHSGTPAMAK
uniref:Sterol O-acyltransferase 2 n=1 Tax=Takifugu rubripes TaxID=31033 RepID=A0A674P2G0_TAKRU